MDAKPAPRVWYAGLNERLTELGKEDPEVYKHWHDWYEPRAKQPLWFKPNSPESLEKLMEALDTAIKERRWTHEPIMEGPDNTWATCVVRRMSRQEHNAIFLVKFDNQLFTNGSREDVII
jgi:hypothetical protein